MDDGRPAAASRGREAERATVRLLLAMTALLGVALLLVNVAGYALLLQRVGPQGFTVVLLLGGGVGLAYGWLDVRLARADRPRARLWTLTGCSAAVAAVGAAVELVGGSVAVAIAVPLLYEVVVVEGQKLVFQLAAERLDVRQSKRLLGRVGAGRWVVYVVLGTALAAAGEAIPVAALLLASAIAFLLLGLVGHRAASPPGRAVSGAEPSGAVPQDRARPRLAWLIALQVVLLFTLSLLADYALLERADSVLDPDQLPRLFAGIGAVEGVLTLLASLLSGPALQRMGVTRALAILPVVVLGLAAGLAAAVLAGAAGVSLALAVAITLSEKTLRNGIARPAVAVLYQPLAPRTAARARAVIEGPMIAVHGAIGALAVGAVLLLEQPAIALSVLMIAFAVAWFVLNRKTAHSYLAELRRGLDLRRLGDGVTLDAGLRSLIAERLADPDPLRVLAAAALLQSAGSEDLARSTDALVRHPDGRVRRMGLRQSWLRGRALDDGLLQTIARTADDLSDRALALAVALRQSRAWAEALAGSDPIAGGIALLTAGSGQQAVAAEESLRAILRHADPDRRRDVASALAAVPAARAAPLLAVLAADEDAATALSAIEAAGAVDDPDLWDVVMARTGDAALLPSAARALERGDDRVVALILERLQRPPLPRPARWRLARILVRNGRSEALVAAALLASHDDARVRGAVFTALRQEQPVLDDRVRELIGSAVSECADRIRSAQSAAEGLAPSLHAAATAAVLRERADLLDGLQVLTGVEEVAAVRDALRDGDSRVLAARVELLEQVLPRADRAVLQELETPSPVASADGAAVWPGDHPCPDRWVAAVSSAAADADTATLVARVEALAGAELFDGTSPLVLLDVAERVSSRSLAAGETLFTAGEAGDAVHIVVAGTISIRAAGVEVNRLHPGHTFGELALLLDLPRSADAVALTDATLLSLDRAAFDDILVDQPEAALAMTRSLGRRLRDATQATPA